jgi:hypothetical protein
MSQTPTKARKPYPLNFFILVTLISILLAIWYVTDYLRGHQTGNVIWYPAAECQLPDETCQVALDKGQTLSFTLHTPEPRPLEPLPVTVRLEGFSEDELHRLKLEIDLQGRDMYMGYNRTPMQYQGEGMFSATPLLSLCTDEMMVWRASILINPTGLALNPVYGSYFDFIVYQ